MLISNTFSFSLSSLSSKYGNTSPKIWPATGAATAPPWWPPSPDGLYKVTNIVTSYIESIKIIKEKAADIDDFDEDIDNSLLYKKIRRIIACIPRASKYAYELCPGGTEDSIKYFDRLKDKVKNIVTSYAECIIEAKDKVKDITDFDDDLDNSILYKRIKGIIACIPRAAKFADELCTEGTSKAIDYFNKLKGNVKNTVATYTECIINVKDKTENLTDFDADNVNDISLFNKIKNIFTIIPLGVKNAYDLCPEGTVNAIDYFVKIKGSLNELSVYYSGLYTTLNSKLSESEVNETNKVWLSLITGTFALPKRR